MPKTPATFDVYLCGPMSGLPDLNADTFHAAVTVLRDQGLTVFNPAEHLTGGDYADAFRADLAALLATTGTLVTLPGWDQGVGSRLEVLTAVAVGLPVRRFDPDQGLGEELFGADAGRDAVADLLASPAATPDQDLTEAPHEEAARLVLGPRGAFYDHPFDNFTRTGLIWSGILYSKLRPGAQVSPEDVALCMVGVKLARESFRHKRDNLTDGHGYLMTHDMVLEERARREANDD